MEPQSHGWSCRSRSSSVSIPERVWWFVELREGGTSARPSAFQSLKGFGGLWNSAPPAQSHPADPFQSLKGFGGLWNSGRQPRQAERARVSIPERVWWFVEQHPADRFTPSPEVSIPERVWWFVERFGLGVSRGDGFVSIPERVWWFVEPRTIATQTRRIANWFQSLKGFGGLWNSQKPDVLGVSLCFNP